MSIGAATRAPKEVAPPHTRRHLAWFDDAVRRFGENAALVGPTTASRTRTRCSSRRVVQDAPQLRLRRRRRAYMRTGRRGPRSSRGAPTHERARKVRVAPFLAAQRDLGVQGLGVKIEQELEVDLVRRDRRWLFRKLQSLQLAAELQRRGRLAERSQESSSQLSAIMSCGPMRRWPRSWADGLREQRGTLYGVLARDH